MRTNIQQDELEQRDECGRNEQIAGCFAALAGLSCLVGGIATIQFAPGFYKALSLVAFCGPGELCVGATYGLAHTASSSLFQQNNAASDGDYLAFTGPVSGSAPTSPVSPMT